MEHFTSEHLVAVLTPSQRYIELSFAGCENAAFASASLRMSDECLRNIEILDLGPISQ